jgi:hypothetical protein
VKTSFIKDKSRVFLLFGLCLLGPLAIGYPLDGGDGSGIRRLQGYINAQQRTSGAKLPPGALLNRDEIHLTLLSHAQIPDFDAAPAEPKLGAALESIFRSRDPSYGVVVVDISDPNRISWAGIRPDTKQNPGSVGKLLTMIGLFDALAQAFPEPDDRARILRETEVDAGDWVLGGGNDVPRYDAATGSNRFGQLRPDDRLRLSEWIDHMISPSANAAASVVWREAILIRHFGSEYPIGAERAEAFFRDTPKPQVTALGLSVISDPLNRAGINTKDIQQGSLWTRTGKMKVPGTVSFSTPRELARVMFRLEQGRLVDSWSSLEMKRYLYTTKRRYRYVFAPELNDAAVYFKSGSFYECKEEPGFKCRKYMGNVRNLMNSVAIIESPARSAMQSDAPAQAPTRYIVALMSNVLRVNSAWDHSRMAAAIDKAVRTRSEVEPKEKADEAEIRAAGEG